MNHFRLIITTLFLMMGVVAKADIVITTDQETTQKVAQVKNITFNGDFNTGNLVLNYTDGTSESFPISTVKQVSFKEDEVDAIEKVSTQPIVAVKGDMLIVTTPGGKAAIYDTAGKLTLSATLNNGTTLLSLGQIQDGIYVMNINGHTVKFQKK